MEGQGEDENTTVAGAAASLPAEPETGAGAVQPVQESALQENSGKEKPEHENPEDLLRKFPRKKLPGMLKKSYTEQRLAKKILITDSGLVESYGVQEQKRAADLFDEFTEIQDRYSSLEKEVSDRIESFVKTKDVKRKMLQANFLQGDRMALEDAVQEIDSFLARLEKPEQNLQVYILAGEIRAAQIEELIKKGIDFLPEQLRSQEGMIYLSRCRNAFSDRITSLKTTYMTCLQYKASSGLEKENLCSHLETINGILQELIPLEKISD